MRRLVALLAIVAAVPAWANDGRLEINQSCVAVGCFPGDNPGFPVETAANQSYVLTSTLVVPDANTGAVALSDHSTLDLNGFAIQGPTVCTGSPAVCPAAGTGWGVYVSAGSTVRNGSILGTGGAGIRGFDGVRVENVVVEGNASDGIRSGNGSEGWSIVGCRIVRNGAIGINLNYGNPAASIVSGNVIRENTSDGIRANAYLIIDNNIHGNGGYGINASYGGDATTYRGNILTANNGGNLNNQVTGAYDKGENHCGNDGVCP